MCSTSTVGASTLGASTLGGRRPRGSSNSLALDELRAVIALHSSEQEQEQQRAGLQGAPGEGGGPPPPQRVPSVDLCHRSQHSALQSPFSNLQDGEATELQRASSLRCNSGSASRASPRGAPGLVQPCADGASPHRRQLEKRCARALQLLERLQNPAHRQGSVFKEALPPAALRYAKGLAFSVQRKAGALLSWDWGNAFVLKRFADGTWSAPIFLRMRCGSVGFTLGMQTVESVSVLQTEQQVLEFCRGQSVLCCDCTLPSAYVDPLSQDEPAIKTLEHKSVSLPQGVEEPHTAILSDGLIIDLSVRAGKSYVDAAMHSALYGSEEGPVEVEQILQGLVEPPREFLPLYTALHEMAGTAQLTRRTQSKYELARQATLSKRLSKKLSFSKLSAGSSSKGGDSRRPQSRNSSAVSPTSATGSQPGSVAGGSPTSTLPLGASLGVFKLFEEVDIGFVEQHSYERQEMEEAVEAAAAGSGAAAAASEPA